MFEKSDHNVLRNCAFSILPGIIFLLQINFLSAQNYSILPNDTVSETVVLDDYAHLKINLPNLSNHSLVFSWELIEYDLDSNWSASACDYMNCYPNIPPVGLMDTLDSGQVALLFLVVQPQVNPGRGVIRFALREPGSTGVSDTLTYIIDALPTGQSPLLNQHKVIIFPNPIKDILALEFSQIPANISIVDLKGTEMWRPASSFPGMNKIQIPTASWPPGICFLIGDDLKTRKIVKF